jgi:hypothetical protein
LERDVALRLDGIVSAIRSQLDWLAHLAKANLPDEDYQEMVMEVGTAMGAIYGISSKLYREFPDIVPAEMKPDS